MRLSNGDVLLRWPLAQHIITAGWLYNDGSLHRALDFRSAVGTPIYAAEAGTVAIAYRWNGKRTQGDINSYGNMVKLRHADYRGGRLETLYAHLSKLCV
ncbi:MAG: M23 family metallopeptidase, partial [Faecalibacterium prausnitzii]|nr:M23 family metallopeptidase [Faecalibacterium prausnitzii]